MGYKLKTTTPEGDFYLLTNSQKVKDIDGFITDWDFGIDGVIPFLNKSGIVPFGKFNFQ